MFRNGDLILQLCLDMSDRPQISSHYLQQESVIDLNIKLAELSFFVCLHSPIKQKKKSTNVVPSWSFKKPLKSPKQ